MKTSLCCLMLLLVCGLTVCAEPEPSLFELRVQEIRESGQSERYMSVEDALNQAMKLLNREIPATSFDLLNPPFSQTGAEQLEKTSSMGRFMLEGVLFFIGTAGLLMAGATIREIRKRKKHRLV